MRKKHLSSGLDKESTMNDYEVQKYLCSISWFINNNF